MQRSTDYEPIDVSKWCNAGLDVLGPGAEPPLGECILRGLPFSVSANKKRCFIAFGQGYRTEPLLIPLGDRSARGLIFLHRMLTSSVMDGGPVGSTIADCSFNYTNGSRIEQAIRERFEIGMPWTWIRDQPALALPDQKHSLPPRYVGGFSRAGRRSTSVIEGPTSYFLWAWRNPNPNRPLGSLAITPRSGQFLLAALTVGNVDEHPLVPTASRTVRIDLLDSMAADLPFDLEVEVDRGYTTYPFPLPREGDEVFLTSPLAGFGETSITGAVPSEGRGPYIRLQPSSPAYVHISATPSATITLRQQGNAIAQAKWAELEEKGFAQTDSARISLIDPGRNWVRTQVVDSKSGAPIPCRIHFHSQDGVPYQPHGHPEQVSADIESWHADIGGDVRLGRIGYAYIDGACEGWLPRGDVLVDVARGFEYSPLRQRINIAPGQQDLVLKLDRWTDMNAKGWFSGDTHVHFLSTAGGHLEGRGEGLNVVNLLQIQAGTLFAGIEDFEGRPNVSNQGDSIVYSGQENRQHFLGHLSLLGLRAPVMPLSSGGSSEAELGGTLETTLSHWADRCHEQGGTVILPHHPVPNGEPAVLIATGRADATEMLEHKMHFHREYYRYLNAGYRLPLVGGTDKMSAEVPVGLFRTYVQMLPDEAFTYESWCANIKRGRTFLSSGPILSFSVEGQTLGDTVRLHEGGGTIDVDALAESIFPIHRLEIIQNGNVVAETVDAKGTRRLALSGSIKVERNSWLAARVGAARYEDPLLFADAWARGVMAHSSPVYVSCGGEWSMFDRDGCEQILTLVEMSLAYVREMALRRPPGTVTHRHSETDHDAYLERPFHEAREAITRRLEHEV